MGAEPARDAGEHRSAESALTAFGRSISSIVSLLNPSTPSAAPRGWESCHYSRSTAGKGAAVERGDSVGVQFTSYTTTGETDGDTFAAAGNLFTYTEKANPEQAIVGFDQGVHGMHVGEVRVLEVPASLNPADNRDILFVVKVVSINS